MLLESGKKGVRLRLLQILTYIPFQHFKTLNGWKRSVLRNDHGFTLLEVLAAAAVLAVGFVGLASVAAGVMRGNVFSSRLTTATVLAQEKMEEIRGLGYAGLPDAHATTVEGYEAISCCPVFKRVASTDIIPGGDGLKKVEVVVYWQADKHRVALKTLIAE